MSRAKHEIAWIGLAAPKKGEESGDGVLLDFAEKPEKLTVTQTVTRLQQAAKVKPYRDHKDFLDVLSSKRSHNFHSLKLVITAVDGATAPNAGFEVIRAVHSKFPVTHYGGGKQIVVFSKLALEQPMVRDMCEALGAIVAEDTTELAAIVESSLARSMSYYRVPSEEGEPDLLQGMPGSTLLWVDRPLSAANGTAQRQAVRKALRYAGV